MRFFLRRPRAASGSLILSETPGLLQTPASRVRTKTWSFPDETLSGERLPPRAETGPTVVGKWHVRAGIRTAEITRTGIRVLFELRTFASSRGGCHWELSAVFGRSQADRIADVRMWKRALGFQVCCLDPMIFDQVCREAEGDEPQPARVGTGGGREVNRFHEIRIIEGISNSRLALREDIESREWPC